MQAERSWNMFLSCCKDLKLAKPSLSFKRGVESLRYLTLGDYALEEIAKISGITRERVRQIETQALKKLKSPNIDRKLKDYISGEL